MQRKGILQKLGLPHHEYWPWWMLVIPVWPMWLWYGVRLRRATWFTTVNPAIEDGGFMGESKIDILNIIPPDLKPLTLFVSQKNAAPTEAVLENYFGQHPFPLIAKPDIGGRGRKIKIVESYAEIEFYHADVAEDYMLQVLVSSPLEFGVFYARIPSNEKGAVISLSSKGFLNVIGDGKSSILFLMKKDKRSAGQIVRLSAEMDLNRVPKENEKVLLEPIGNHCKGTKFINDTDRVTKKMNETFDEISKRIGGFYYGRFDIRVPNWEDLENGKNISILELNGLTADAAHIFDPNYRLRDVFKTQFKHIRIAADIAKENIQAGTKATPVIELAKKSWEALKLM